MSKEKQSIDKDIEYTLVLDGADDGRAVIRELNRMVPEETEETAVPVSEEAADAAAVPPADVSVAPAAKDALPEEIEYTHVLDGDDDGYAVIRELERMAPPAAGQVTDETVRLDALAEGAAKDTLARTQMFGKEQQTAVGMGASDTVKTSKSTGLKEDEDIETAAADLNDEPGPDDEEIREKIEKRKIEKALKEKHARIRLYTFIILFFALLGFFALSVTNLFTVDSIEVKGNNHFTWEEIINIGHATPGRNIIYDLNKKTIVDYLEQNPYIKSANVRRKLPSTIVIEVQERTQTCAFKYDDDFLIMDEDGILLKKTRTEPKLTIISGIVVNKIKLGQKVGAKNSNVLNKILDLVRAMRRSDMYFVRIDMNEDDAVKAYIYDNLSVKSRYDVLVDNLNNGRLHKIVEKLFEKGIKRGTITFASDGSAAFEPGI